MNGERQVGPDGRREPYLDPRAFETNDQTGKGAAETAAAKAWGLRSRQPWLDLRKRPPSHTTSTQPTAGSVGIVSVLVPLAVVGWIFVMASGGVQPAMDKAAMSLGIAASSATHVHPAGGSKHSAIAGDLGPPVQDQAGQPLPGIESPGATRCIDGQLAILWMYQGEPYWIMVETAQGPLPCEQSEGMQETRP